MFELYTPNRCFELCFSYMCKDMCAQQLYHPGEAAVKSKAADLEKPLPKNGVLGREQSASHIGVSHLQEVKLWGQGEADALLCQQCPASSPWLSSATLCTYLPENSVISANQSANHKQD